MTAPPLPHYRGVDWDDELERSDAAFTITSHGTALVELWLESNASQKILTPTIVLDFHRMVFNGLFPDFAGRLRGPAPRYVPTDVEFGNFHGTRHMDVPAAFDTLCRNCGRMIADLDHLRDQLDPDDFDREVLKVAAYLHCEIVRIHPFVNGNGRTARICLSYFAHRYGMLPVTVARPKGEYLEANVTWLQMRVIDHMVDFLWPLWKRQTAG